MKKLLKSRIFSFIFGALIFGSIGVLATTAITADQVNYDENTTVKDKIDDLYTKANRDTVLEHITNSTHGKSTSLTKTYTATSDVTVTAIIMCSGFNAETPVATYEEFCNYTSNGQLQYITPFSHERGGFTYSRIIQYKLTKDQYITLNVKSGGDIYWYAGYDILVTKK